MRHDKIAAAIHWHLSKKYGFQCGEKSYQHFVSKDNSVLANDEVKILWDFSIQTEQNIEHNRPDITIFDKKEKQCYLIDVACPFDTRIQKKEKVDAYTDLKYEGDSHPNSHRNTWNNTKETEEEIGGHWNKDKDY